MNKIIVIILLIYMGLGTSVFCKFSVIRWLFFNGRKSSILLINLVELQKKKLYSNFRKHLFSGLCNTLWLYEVYVTVFLRPVEW